MLTILVITVSMKRKRFVACNNHEDKNVKNVKTKHQSKVNYIVAKIKTKTISLAFLIRLLTKKHEFKFLF